LGWVDARIEYAQYLLDQGANERAMEDAQASYRQAPDQPKAVEVMVRAAMALSQTDLAKATLEEASNLPYKSAKMYDVIREGWTALKDEARARAAAEAARKQDPTSLDGREAMARSLVRENRFAEAEAIMLKAIEQEPNMPGLHVTLGAIYDLDGRGLDALQEYRKAVEIQPSSARWRVILAQALANRGQSDQSLREFEQARALDPKDLDILFAHLQLSIRMGLPVRSDDLKRLETYQRGAKLAMAYAQGGQIDKAIQECRAVLDKEPSNRDALWVLARAYQLSDRPESARTELTKLLTLNPEDDQAYVDLVRLLSRQSSMDEVRAAMGSIRGLLSTKIDLAIARLLLTDARYEAAAEAFGRVVADSKAKADIRHEALLNRVSALAMANQTDQALREIEPLLSEAAWKMEASLTKAAMLISVKKLDDAKSLLAQIRTEAQRTKNNRLLERLVRVYMSIPAADEALATCDRLETVLVEGQTADAHQLRAGVLVAAGRPAEALPYYQKALEARPQAFVIRRDLARVLELSGRPLEARKQLEMLVTAGAGDTARLLGRLELADMYGRWGMSQKALAVLRDVVADGYDDPAVRLATGKALANLGQKDEATKQFRTITPFDKQYVEAQQMMVRMTSDRTARREILNNLAVKRPNDPDVLRFTLQALADSGDWMEADGQFREFSRDNYARTVPPQDIAVMAVSIRAELGRLEDAGALAALMYKDTKSAIWRATALCLMVDRQSDDAKALLPPVAEATYFDAVYGYLLHRRGPQGPAWLSRLKTLRDEPLPLSAKPPVPALSRLLVSLVIGEDPAAAQAALAKEGFLARLAGDELIAYAKANATSAANEAAELLKAETARLVPFASMAHALSMKILQKRPECLAAAALACETKPNSDVYRQVADIVRPADGVLARAFRGALLSMENKHPEAISVLQGLVADGHGESAVLSWLARSLEAAGRKAEAAKYYRELWKLNPQDIRAANNAAYLLALSNPTDKQTLSEARAWIAEAVAKAPGVLAIRDTSGWIAYLEGRNQDAVVDLLAASRAIPGSPEVHAHLGLAALAVGDQELSRLHLEAAVSLYQAVLDAKLEATPAMTEAVNQARGALDKNWPDWQKGRA
jgi:tetratricopeptide (TPR) repeat protein